MNLSRHSNGRNCLQFPFFSSRTKPPLLHLGKTGKSLDYTEAWELLIMGKLEKKKKKKKRSLPVK